MDLNKNIHNSNMKESKKNTIIQKMVSNFKKSRKDLIIQILWIIAVGIILWLVYNSQGAKQIQETKPLESHKTIEQLCMDIAIEKANQPDWEGMAETGNPYLTKKDIPGMRENTKKIQFKECMDIWGN